MPKKTVAAVAVLLGLSALAYHGITVGASQPSQPQLIAQPAEWVAFEAQLQVTTPGEPTVHGRFFRASDGSTRIETGPALDDIRVVGIRNVSEGSYYWRNARREWKKGPMVLPPAGYRPVARKVDTPGLFRVPERMIVDSAGSLAHDPSGFEVYLVASNLLSAVEVPALNFFRIVRQSIQDGRRETYYDIVLKEPAATLFVPSPGETVELTDKPAGIVFGQ